MHTLDQFLDVMMWSCVRRVALKQLTSLGDVHGGASHNLSIMSNSNMPNIEVQPDSSLDEDLTPVAYPCHRDIERTFLTHHQHLIQLIWKHSRKTHGPVLERILADPETLVVGASIVNKASRGRKMMMSSRPRQRFFRPVSRWRSFVG